jgi:hypothetical protein
MVLEPDLVELKINKGNPVDKNEKSEKEPSILQMGG